ncbi:tripartite tricarboxylate transporter TctB family protein [Salibacterium aidingense]|uniref:tripartite tricarboxylate transporter TctB family protein n=1 Tax=Salibacterium aidingense TaxID=384933 RepID=UPI00047BCA1A|nr:tripartite tricarboxylate transporter TctB family protein [Salibacterium aidingense]
MSILIKHTLVSGLILTLTIMFYIESLKFPESAARLPQITIVIIALLAIAMFIEAYKKRNDQEKEEEEKINIQRLLVFGTSIAAYIFLINIIGYLIITPIFCFLILMYFKATNLILAIILSLGFTAFIHGVFIMFLNIPVPMGILS